MNRRTILKAGIASFAGMYNLDFKRPNKKYCFNTLSCPDWTWEEIILNAQKMGFSAVEVRGIGAEIDLRKCQAFSPANILSSKKIAGENGIKILNLNSSAHLHETEIVAKNKNLDEVKAYIDLAVQLGSDFVRVFPEKFVFENEKQKSIDLLIENLGLLTQYANGSGVKVLLDAHGDLVWSADIQYIMENSDRDNSGVIWDYFNMHLKTGETPEKMHSTLKDYIKIIQIKDGFFLPDKKYEYCLTGKGEVPISKILELAKKDKFAGYISFEWEKRWHPELPNPEIALPQFMKFMS